MTKVLVLGRERPLVDRTVALIEQSGFDVIGVTDDAEALGLLDTGRFAAVLIGGGVLAASRPLVRQHAALHGAAVLESRRTPFQTVQDHVRRVVVPRLLRL